MSNAVNKNESRTNYISENANIRNPDIYHCTTQQIAESVKKNLGVLADPTCCLPKPSSVNCNSLLFFGCCRQVMGYQVLSNSFSDVAGRLWNARFSLYEHTPRYSGYAELGIIS
ncbi:hypothetical protein AVEN_41188-1 [Araneus ventricosus]|uniref:Uncharacterized protein n=1 Tax=Araneus ventricosus TaxID=182803 RepID=A0A4Y2THC1_ARAVE|nr:hypothetical protein AVEN_51047-1 [Araneus ventricosus]GBN98836.1 hypothetical protein AVEN_41188-1 [Araneus ventricosus]